MNELAKLVLNASKKVELTGPILIAALAIYGLMNVHSLPPTVQTLSEYTMETAFIVGTVAAVVQLLLNLWVNLRKAIAAGASRRR